MLKPLWVLRSSFSVSCLQASESDSQNVFKLTERFVYSVFTSRGCYKLESYRHTSAYM